MEGTFRKKRVVSSFSWKKVVLTQGQFDYSRKQAEWPSVRERMSGQELGRGELKLGEVSLLKCVFPGYQLSGSTV